MEGTVKITNRNLLLFAGTSIFFFLSIQMISEFTSRLLRDILLNFLLEYYIIFVIESLLHLSLIILGILWLKNLLLRSDQKYSKFFKYSIFSFIFSQSLYIFNPFLYHLFDIQKMNNLWTSYALFPANSYLLSGFKFLIPFFSYIFLAFVFYKNRNEVK